MSPAEWLVYGGLIPVFGATLLFFIGCALKGTTTRRGLQRKSAWYLEAVDARGWLFAAALIAAESAVRHYGAMHKEADWLTVGSGITVMCAIVLMLFVMSELAYEPLVFVEEDGGSDEISDDPSKRFGLNVIAIGLAVAALSLGYKTRCNDRLTREAEANKPGVTKCPPCVPAPITKPDPQQAPSKLPVPAKVHHHRQSEGSAQPR